MDAFDHWVNGDLTLSNITVLGDDALDYDGDEVEDGDAQLDAYAADNGVVVNNNLEVDYLFAFNSGGTTATDTLNLECGSGSGHAWALGWTFCDAINLFGGAGTVNSVGDVSTVSLTVWPNPSASANVRVSGLTAGAQLEVRDVLGHIVWRGQATGETAVLPVAGLSSGTYLLNYNEAGIIGRQRFIIQ